MIRMKDRFYWSDALYLARAKNELVLKEAGPQSEIFQCVHCSAFVRFFKNVAGATSGKWSRIKPYEQFQLQKKFSQPVQTESLKEIRSGRGGKKLYRCQTCASHWWNDHGAWDSADDEAVEKQTGK
ncbi:hypothetical protein JNM05_01960 [bacterium]|nr:hypothetical protein [bacterium]